MSPTLHIREILSMGPVLPVVSIEDPRFAVPLARAVVAGGIRTVEITLRTPAALDCIRAISAAVPEVILGAGTILSPDDLLLARDAGARFGVSPGASSDLLKAVREIGFPFLPGVMSPSEVMRAASAGFTTLKLFPAQTAGGVALLKALAGPFPGIRFCPTGGISSANAPDYLALDNVLCVGGSWITPPEVIKAGDWAEITRLARHAAGLPRPGLAA
jgi:2-dehydro-3-deoxyphosphogluconate aldolase / (4S)-4-hydroxy-2-oxoglutarate aldolase